MKDGNTTTDDSKADSPAVLSKELLGHLRQTGRTTRMLEHAKNLDEEGRAVYVIADNLRDARRFEIILGQVLKLLGRRGKPVGKWRHAQVTGTGESPAWDSPLSEPAVTETAAATGGETRLNCACNVRSPSRVVLAVIGYVGLTIYL
jgi:hypothetical protein